MTTKEIYLERRYQHGVYFAPALKEMLRETPEKVITEDYSVLEDLIQYADDALIFGLIATGDFELVQLFVEAGGDITHVIGDHGSPLDFAMYLGYVDIFDYLYPLLCEEDMGKPIHSCWNNDYFFTRMLPHLHLTLEGTKGISFLFAVNRLDRIDAIVQEHGVDVISDYDDAFFTALKYKRSLDFFTRNDIRPSQKFLWKYKQWLSEDEIKIVESYV